MSERPLCGLGKSGGRFHSSLHLTHVSGAGEVQRDGGSNDDMGLLATRLTRFDQLQTFYTDQMPENVAHALKENGPDVQLTPVPQTPYLGKPKKKTLPADTTVHLSFADKARILQWANGKADAVLFYILQTFHEHLANMRAVQYGHNQKQERGYYNEQKRSAIYGAENPHAVHGKGGHRA